MCDRFTVQLALNSPRETEAVAKKLASASVSGNVFFLSGDLGSGKTHFARAFIQERLSRAGLFEDVPSPTYTLVQTYWDGSLEIWHADLYRLADPTEVIELGLVDTFNDAICLIEWPEGLTQIGPDNPIFLDFKPGHSEDSRQLTISAKNSVHPEIVASLKMLANV